jgi:hypothetical protein
MKYIFVILFVLSVGMHSCDVSHKPYLKNKVELKQLAGNCSNQSDQFSMNSNINGERYIFQECLNEGATKDDVMVTRKGDTVSIQFKKQGSGMHLFELTVDVNTQPRYNFLTIGDNTIPIIPAGN